MKTKRKFTLYRFLICTIFVLFISFRFVSVVARRSENGFSWSFCNDIQMMLVNCAHYSNKIYDTNHGENLQFKAIKSSVIFKNEKKSIQMGFETESENSIAAIVSKLKMIATWLFADRPFSWNGFAVTRNGVLVEKNGP